MVVIALPVQMAWVAGVATTVGAGLTTTVAVIGAPAQPLAIGVTVNITVCAILVVLVSVPLIFPLPLTGMPVTLVVLFLVQL